MTQREALDAVLAELSRARSLHPIWPSGDPIHAAAVVAEGALRGA